MARIKAWLIVLLVSLLSHWGVQMTTIEEEDTKSVDDNEHMFI